MELRQLRYFVDIAQTEHLTTSARQLFVTQSTLSHGLKLLEEELGVQLFDRVGRGLKLSQAGAVFLQYAARALRELNDGRMALSALNQLEAGSLSVGVIPTFLHSYIPQAVARFNAQHPRVKVLVRDMLAPQIEAGLLAGELDLGVAFYPPASAEVAGRPLFEEQLLLAAREAHPLLAGLAADTALPMAALAGVPLALLSPRFATRRMIDEAFASAGVRPTVRVEMESIMSLIEACRHADLVTIVPDRAMQGKFGLRTQALTPALIRTAGLLWRQAVQPNAAAERFVQFLVPELDQGTPQN